MPPKMYEFKVVRGQREVRDATFVNVLDLNDQEATRDLMNRHVIGAALRAGAGLNHVHEFVLEVREVRAGKGYGEPVLRWALPAAPEVRP